MHILKLQNFVAMPQTDNDEAFLFVTPRSRSLISLLPERHTFLHFWRFLTDHHIWCSLAEGLPYLVIALKSTRARPFWAPVANTKNHNLPDRLPSTTTSKTETHWKFWLSLQKSSKLQKIENFKHNSNFPQFWPKPLRFWNLSYSKTEATIQRPKGKNCKTAYIEIIEPTVSI